MRLGEPLFSATHPHPARRSAALLPPWGKQRRIRTLAAPLARQGQGSVISPPRAAIPDLTFRGAVPLRAVSGKYAALTRLNRVPGGKLCASKNPALCCGHPAVEIVYRLEYVHLAEKDKRVVRLTIDGKEYIDEAEARRDFIRSE